MQMTITPTTCPSAKKQKREKNLTQQQQNSSCLAVLSTTPMKILPQRIRTKNQTTQQEWMNSTVHRVPLTGIEPGTSSITVVAVAAALSGHPLKGLGTAAPAAAAAVDAWRRGIGRRQRHQQQ
jgi:hypothetical protein